jgi:ribonuclease E
MAESTSTPSSGASDGNDPDRAPVRKTRRRAGSPAGAPTGAVTPAAAEPATSQPHTIVAGQHTEAAPQAETSAAAGAPAMGTASSASTRSRRRRAGSPAGPPSEPVAPQTPETPAAAVEEPEQDEEPDELEQSAPAPETDQAADGADEETTGTDSERAAAGRDDAGVVADLNALAKNHPSNETSTSDEDERSRKAQAQMDFASLLFQAPEPAHDRPGRDTEDDGDEDTPSRSEAPATTDHGSADLSFDAPRPSRRRRATSSGKVGDRPVREGEESGAAGNGDGQDDEDTSAQDSARTEGDEEHQDSSESSSSSRRRRRRGGRGRRGRGNGEASDSSEQGSEAGEKDSDVGRGRSEGRQGKGSKNSQKDSSGTESGQGEGKDTSSAPDDSSQDDGEDGGNGDSNGSSSSSSRRRRRRRRSGSSSSGEASSSDDPPNTVVKVREARDEVKAVKGSTRLEAKRQRRREGRDQGRRRSTITEAEFLARRESVKRSMVVRELPGRTQIAVLEDDVLVEHFVAQKSQTSAVGNVYLGKVQNVLPSMEAAFVDIGRGRNAVLYAGEVNWDAVGQEGQPRRIELALKSGDPVLVQVTKDPIGHKGARLTSQISLPGRYVVFVPGGSMTGISRKLPDAERSRLKKILKKVVPSDAGVIVRTAAEGASEEELTRDVQRLQSQWDSITTKQKQKTKSAPAALSTEPDLAIKVVRDVFNEDFTSLIVEGDNAHKEIHDYVSSVAPDLLERVTKHVGDKDVFAKHRIDEQLLKAMDRVVYLPSGGSLVIDRTEAMTVIDVNTGKFTGSGGSLEETVTRNNLEAAEEIVRQLRLRDIGGIIVVDFIDMVLESNRDLVLRRLVECLGRDRTKHQVAEVTSLGLVQMTRKRVGAGLVETFSTQCEACNGRGLVVDMDGHAPAHQHLGRGDHDSSGKSSKRKGGKKSKSGNRGGDGGGSSESASNTDADSKDVHRLEDESAREQTRASIASIAKASSPSSEDEGAGSGTHEMPAAGQGDTPSKTDSDTQSTSA